MAITRYFEDYAETLYNNGYDIIPIKRGQKAPALWDWSTVTVDKQAVDKWIVSKASCGIGLRTRMFPAIDIDVLDAELADQVEAACASIIGFPPYPLVRVGRAPKRLLLCRAAAPFRKIRSTTFVPRSGGDEIAVEILGDGQQCVIYGIHPTTQLPYQWEGPEIRDVRADSLPVLTREKAIQVIEAFEALADLYDYVPVRGRITDRPSGKLDAFETYKRPLDITLDEINETLRVIEPDAYDVWLRVGMGLYHQYDGAVEGFYTWDEWSRGSDKYPGSDSIRRKWDGFEADVMTNAVTFASAIHLAGEKRGKMREADPLLRKPDAELHEYIRRFAFITEKSRVVDLDSTNRITSVRELKDFKNENASFKMLIKLPKKAGGWEEKMVNGVDQWLSCEDRKTLRDIGYHVAHEPIIKLDNGDCVYNQFFLPEHPELSGRPEIDERSEVFRRHIDYLFPHENERLWFTQWMAYNIQLKTAITRCKVTPLLVTDGVVGTGRGAVAKVLELLVGPHNTSKTTIAQITGENFAGAYNSYVKNSMFCFVEEVRDNSKRYELNDKLKDLLEADRLDVNVKFGGKGLERIYTSFLLMTNEPDAIVIPRKQRRIQVLEGPRQARPDSYYGTLYNWMRDPRNISAVFSWLESIDLSDFNYSTADLNLPGFKRMVATTQSGGASIVEDWINQEQPRILPNKTLLESVLKKFAIDVGFSTCDITPGIINHMYKMAIDTPKRVSINGNKMSVWVIDRALAGADNDELRKELSRLGIIPDTEFK